MATFTVSNSSLNWRTYNLRVPVRSYFWEAVRGESILGRRPQPTPTVALEIGAVKGVQSFYFHEGYELTLHKADAYSWEEVEAQIAEAIDKHNATAEWPTFGEVEYVPELLALEDDSDYADDERLAAE